ncbi:hypothetical protein pipiens_004156 [Culex pipiens pipiens]|uniref:Single domain-containing protein n=1 Tax=Culex pipiens pipiens TaxID=38569 RepID=A0ABD1CME2_CULPP
MKLFLVLSLAICCLLQQIAGYVAFLPNATHPDHPGKCYDPDSKTVVEKGSAVYQNCEKWSCSDDYFLQITGCGLAMADGDCRLETDSSKQYPECCPKIVC